ncbi:TIR domain-containing protein [Algoriphagus litoralis]|uniref:TIR domain-containing protein n=1 Tax=Algoriphagus litoralis TaxID=2202829 RepID=UPI000DB9342A|nr:nucleotide-binding protein [Algoriphagus litoralis]
MSEEIPSDPTSLPVDYLSPMLDLINSSLLTLNTQDLQEITIILQKGKSLYNKASKVYEPNEFELRIMEMCLLSIQSTYYFIKAAYSKLEEKYSQALTEFQKTVEICTAGKILIAGLLQEDEKEFEYALFFYHFLFSFIQFSAEGEGLEIAHEIKIEAGEFSDYSAVLLASAAKYRQINDLDLVFDDTNPTVPALIKLLNRLADIKEDKADKIHLKKHTLKHVPIRSKKIFLIHGHAEGLLLELQEILEKRLGMECVILKKESNQGDSVIEKFERNAGECGYAFAILSTDDIIQKDGGTYFQARPNVLFEMGWFYGRYGRKNVCLLKQKDVVMPSDLGGIICLEFSQKISEVYLEIEKELDNLSFLK